MLPLFGYAFLSGLCLGVIEIALTLHFELRRKHAEQKSPPTE